VPGKNLSRSNFSCDAAIIGSGIAASSCALRLLQLGIQPLLISHGMRLTPGVEAIPESAFALLREVGLEPAIQRADPEQVHGFDNHWLDTHRVTSPGEWVYINRCDFAQAALDEALTRGARLKTGTALLVSDFPAGAAVIDATGRSAVVSRPVERRGRNSVHCAAPRDGARPRGLRIDALGLCHPA
jgi:flavin-dependent dehydrogenase